LLNRRFLSHADNTASVPLAESLISFSCRRLARFAARCIPHLFLLTTSYQSRRSQNRSFLGPAEDTPTAPLGLSLVSFSFRPLARRAARYIARFFLLPILFPLFRQLNCSVLFVADFLSVVPVAVSVVLLSMSGARLIALFFHPSMWCPACRSLVLIPILTILLRRDFVCATHG
jgi:hypothetical protein